MAQTINLGKVGLTFDGDYDSSKNYASKTCVFYNHVSWVSKKDVPAGIAPGNNEEYWQKVSERGDQGIQGERGPQGNSAFDGTGIELVNNLTQGGEASALSAEQGKILKTELTELESEVLDIGINIKNITSDRLTPLKDGGVILLNGDVGNRVELNIQDSPLFSTYIINCKEGDAFIVKGYGGTSARLWGFIDKSNILLSVADAVIEKRETPNFLAVAPKGSVKAIFNINLNEYAKGEVVRYITPPADKELNVMDFQLVYKNFQWENRLVNGYSLASVENQNYRLSTPIFLKKGTIVSTSEAGNAVSILSLVDRENNIVASVFESNNSSSYQYTIELDGVYKICYKTETESAPYVKINGIDITQKSVIENIEERIDLIDGLAFSNITFIDGVLMTSELSLQEQDYWRTSKPFFIKKGTLIKIVTSGRNVSLITKCNKDGVYQSVVLKTYDSENSTSFPDKYQYTIQEDGYYVISYKYRGLCSYFSINDEIYDKRAKHLNMLLLGNSYMADAWTYVPILLKEYGITCNVVLYCRGALSLENLYNRWEETQEVDVETENINAGTYNREIHYIDTRYKDAWEDTIRGGISAKMLTEAFEWDIVAITQWSGLGIDINSYEPWADKVIGLIRESLPTPYTLVWSQPWTRKAYDYPEQNIEASIQNQKNEPYILNAPCGTAIFNARQVPSLANLGITGNLWSDEVHLQEGIPKYVAALAVTQSLLNKYSPEYSILGNRMRPTEDLLTRWNMLQWRGYSVGVTEENCYLAQKCAIQAIKYPFEIVA